MVSDGWLRFPVPTTDGLTSWSYNEMAAKLSVTQIAPVQTVQ